jgi:energy-coupling factor transporter transmembrane protein EcfT
MVTVIGACGLCIVIFSVIGAINPIKNRDLIIGLIITCFILAVMYAYLITSGNFPVRELFNLVLSALSGAALLLIYPWKIARTI